MTGTVPIISIAFMILMGIVVAIIPIALLIFFRKKGADYIPFIVGCVVFFIFAQVLEALVHQIVLVLSPAGPAIQGSIVLYAIYGGLMAGLFEEVGRFTAFKTVLGDYQDKDINAFMYGAGHGGFEAITIFSLTMVSNVVISFMINSGTIDTITATMTDEQALIFMDQIGALSTTPFYMFGIGTVERIIAMILHIALSVIVWVGAKYKGKGYLLLLAIFLHGFVDAVTVFIANMGLNSMIVELILAVIVCAIVFITKSIYTFFTKLINEKW